MIFNDAIKTMERLLMTLDDEIRKEISLLPEQPEIVDDWEHIADELSDSYSWAGSKLTGQRPVLIGL